MNLSLNPKTVLQIMLGIIALLAVMHITQLFIYYQINDPDIFDFIEILDFDYEANLPSYYSSTAILFCAVLLWCIGRHEFQHHTVNRLHWLGLAVIFTFLGIDEAIAIHEDVGDFFEERQWVDASGYLYFAWVVPYGILLLLFALSYLRFIIRLPAPTRTLFISAGTLFITGAIGIEIISAREADMHGTETIMYSSLYTIEELFEMIGIAIFCYAILRHIEAEYGHIRLNIDSDK